MFLSGTFGLSEGIALYPTESIKDEFWSTYRRVTDLAFEPAAIHAALQRVADTFHSKIDPSPSGAGVALSIAVDPNFVTFDMLRTSVALHLERAGVPSASLSTTFDQIQRQQAKIMQRGGDVTRVELTFFLEASGFALSPQGHVRSEQAEEARAHAVRAEEEKEKAFREVKAEVKNERLAELAERTGKDKEIAELRERVADLERIAKEKAERAKEAKDEFRALREAEAPTMVAATEQTRDAVHEGLVRAQENLEERTAGMPRDELKETIDRAYELEIERAETRRKIRVKSEEERAETERVWHVAVPPLPVELEALTPRERAARVVPCVRPPEAERPQKRAPWNKKTQDMDGRWRNGLGRFVSAPKSTSKKTSKKKTAKKATKKATKKGKRT